MIIIKVNYPIVEGGAGARSEVVGHVFQSDGIVVGEVRPILVLPFLQLCGVHHPHSGHECLY